MTVSGALVGSASAQGVRQVCPLDVFASAPGGVDSKRTVSMIGAGFSASTLNQSGVEEHAASARPPPTIAMTRYILFLTHPLERQKARAPIQNTFVVMAAQPGAPR